MAYQVLQNTRINTNDFIFLHPDTVTYPVKPLVSVKLYEPNGVPTLKIRATLYINSLDPNNPTVEEPTELEDTLQIYFDYDFSEETPESCDVWYVELDYTSDTVKNITEVVSYLKDLDPETSRGTKTKVDD
ncbi:hypothetical protein [Flavobacterium sp. YO12]|uniref:hypothetical protein n=1 Tax=Flavobacterium sp. YO12 TaxID=1920029 RepID=UPI00100A5EA2|nr:hypothetical protein [Flavobacterium sp. YO12]RXM48736.1 hypothetical protein BOW55_03940 [Flavobacterium sp. YO12]